MTLPTKKQAQRNRQQQGRRKLGSSCHDAVVVVMTTALPLVLGVPDHELQERWVARTGTNLNRTPAQLHPVAWGDSAR